MAQKICPKCEKLVPLRLLETEMIHTKLLGNVEILAFQCPDNHIFYNLALDERLGKKAVTYITSPFSIKSNQEEKP